MKSSAKVFKNNLNAQVYKYLIYSYLEIGRKNFLNTAINSSANQPYSLCAFREIRYFCHFNITL